MNQNLYQGETHIFGDNFNSKRIFREALAVIAAIVFRIHMYFFDINRTSL